MSNSNPEPPSPKWQAVIFFICILILPGCAAKLSFVPEPYDYTGFDKDTKTAHKRVEKFIVDLAADTNSRFWTLSQKTGSPFPVSPLTRIDSLKLDPNARSMHIYLNKVFSHPPFRDGDVAFLYDHLKKRLGRKFRRHAVTLLSLETPIEDLVPNAYRSARMALDSTRLPPEMGQAPIPFVTPLDRVWTPSKGLLNRNIVIWHSHGWYYNLQKDRWEWQRPRLFQTVEDLLPLSFTLPYLVPMLENAGARVFMPRERDPQVHEVVIDNDSAQDDSLRVSYVEHAQDSIHFWQASDTLGFALDQDPYPFNVNPFRLGTYKFVASDTTASATINWIPDIPESGFYTVSIAYGQVDSCVSQAQYEVFHLGGKSAFAVNQCMGGGTWIYLGRFKFKAGMNPDSGRVTLSNKQAEPGGIISADAVKFGGGMGNIERNGRTSGRPRFMEGARYYLQYAGMPDSLVFDLNESVDDYKDDYQSRGEYVNYLHGAPFGPNLDRSQGLGIPIDLSLAFHTDAGITDYDTTIGTLSIYSIVAADTQTVFPDSVSRLANRDLADIMQTEIVNDLRAKYHPQWRRRALLEAQYSEAVRPNVPAMLLELLSHQNYWDMRFALDPRFRFDASRAIYKGILKFLTFQNREPYLVQPLPVTHFRTQFSDSAQVTLNWRSRHDPLAPTAVADRFIVYTRKNDDGFDQGQLVRGHSFTQSDLDSGVVYSFKVTAANDGGESFPSEVLAVSWIPGDLPPVLIINGFDRISGPARIEEEKMLGFFDRLDQGVPDGYDLNTTGSQVDFLPQSGFRLNDAPGLGASQSDLETKIIPGNTFDFARVHGEALLDNGRSFVSVSDEAVMDSLLDITRYRLVDLILGEERETFWPAPYGDSLLATQFHAFPETLRRQLRRLMSVGGDLFVSGAYVGTDLAENKPETHPDVLFAQGALRFSWTANHAARSGGVFATDSSFMTRGEEFSFNAGVDPAIYQVEAPDAIDPVAESRTILRYAENRFSAGTAYHGDYGVVVFGFPFETITDRQSRARVMSGVIDFFRREPLQLSGSDQGR